MHTSISCLNIFKSCFLFLLPVFIILPGCSDNKNGPKDGEAVHTAESESVQGLTNRWLYPTGFGATDTHLIVLEPDASGEMVKILSQGDFTLKHSFGTEGEGPGEFSTFLKNPVSVTGSRHFSLFDWSRKKIWHIDPEQGWEKGADNEPLSAQLPPELMLAQKAAFLNDSTIVSSGAPGGGFLSFTHIPSGEVSFFNPLELQAESMGMRTQMYYFESDIAIHFGKKRIAVAPQHLPEIFIVDFTGELLHRHSYSEYNPEAVAAQESTDRTVFSSNLSAGDEHFYMAGTGLSNAELDMEMDKVQPDELLVSEVKRFTWEGVPAGSMQLKGGFYPFISVLEVQNSILSLDRLSQERDFVSFETDW